jgi:hypothetical protein
MDESLRSEWLKMYKACCIRMCGDSWKRGILWLQLPATITDRQIPNKNSYISDRSGALSQLAQQRRASSSSIPSDQPGGLTLVTDEADVWRVNYLIFRPMDLRTMETKASKNKYCSLQEFRADAETIVHNVVIYHGGRPCAVFVSSHVKEWGGRI